VSGGFFDTVGMSIVDGRTFSDSDVRDTQPVAIVSEAMARRYWPDGTAVGRILRRPDPAEPDVVIVGVASNINIRSLGEAPRDVVYVPHSQSMVGGAFSVVARTSTDPARLLLALAAAAREADPDVRIAQSTTMAQHLAMSRLPSQLGAFLLSAFAVLAMALAAIGVYGLVRYTVARRSREVGIRMALGADAGRVARLLATDGLRPVLVGGVIGVAVSLVAARVLAALLFGVGVFEPVAVFGPPLVLGLAASLAAYLPARRASRSAPLAALRSE
jgi:ABC-type antimicrobial peptide transport system permease subunit